MKCKIVYTLPFLDSDTQLEIKNIIRKLRNKRGTGGDKGIVFARELNLRTGSILFEEVFRYCKAIYISQKLKFYIG